MLVLSREKNQSLVIGDLDNGGIEVFVVEVRGKQVRLGVKAGEDVPVHRREVYDAIKQAYGRVGASELLAVSKRSMEKKTAEAAEAAKQAQQAKR